MAIEYEEIREFVSIPSGEGVIRLTLNRQTDGSKYYLHLRRWHVKDGSLRPGKGVVLPPAVLVQVEKGIHDAVKAMGEYGLKV